MEIKEHDKMFEELVSKIIEMNSNPEDHYEVVALLESFGWNDLRASSNFGVEDLFELGINIYDAIKKRGMVGGIVAKKRVSIFQTIVLLAKSFLRGVIFALPMAISVIAMLTLKLSLWSYQYLSTELATSIAIATILSFITIGGFTQAIARRGYFYISQDYYNMARKITFKFIKMGYIAAGVVIVVLVLLNTFFNLFPLFMLSAIVIYYLLLCAIWLSVTVMYILQKEILFTALLSIGIAIVYFLFNVIGIDIIFSQLIALTIVSILGSIMVYYYFRKAEAKMEKGIAAKLPRMSITIYSVTPYFLYGISYFSFLYVDRVMAWSTNDIFMPYLIWFRGAYELGLDFGLLGLMIPMGVNEVIINNFVLNLEFNENSFKISDTKLFNGYYFKLYFKALITSGIISILSAIFVYAFVRILNGELEHLGIQTLITSDVTWFVFEWSLVAYAVIATSLLNAVTMFSLSNPYDINKAILYAFSVNCIVGFLLSRWADYHYAIFGLVIGAFVFLYFSTKAALKTINELDYYLYAAS